LRRPGEGTRPAEQRSGDDALAVARAYVERGDLEG